MKTFNYTVYTATEFCDENGWTLDDLGFDGYKPDLVWSSNEGPYCVVRCIDMTNDELHFYVFGARIDREIEVTCQDDVLHWMTLS